MKLLVLGAVLGAMVVGTLPASAEIVVRGGDEGMVVRSDRDRHEGRRHESWRRHQAECRVVKVRTHLPNGNVVVRSQRTCD